MDDKPPRRWFRFRLSTVLILTAILAWAMAYGPFVTVEYVDRQRNILRDWEFGDIHSPSTSQVKHRHAWGLSFASRPQGPYGNLDWGVFINVGPIPRVFYPLGGLAAFIAWKAAWAVVERRRARVS